MLAARWQAHGLDREGGSEHVLALLLALGVQDTPYGSAARALAARGVAAPAAGPLEAGPLVWSWRGAPHLHRAADLPALAAALWPVSDADATRRIATTSIRDGARRGLEAFTAAAEAMRRAVTRRLPKGEVSTLVSAQVPADLTHDCAPCGARHVSGALFQQVGLAAGVRVVPDGRGTCLEPLPDDVRPPAVPVCSQGTPEALLRYVELCGPASPAHLAAVLGTTPAVATGLVAPGLVRVRGPAGPAWTTPSALARAGQAEPPRGTRLLPPSDPWLQARDREVVVPDAARRRAVWRPISSPGVVLVDGEVAGTWRSATASRNRTRVSVEAFAPLAPRVRGELDGEARLVAVPRDPCADVEVVVRE